MSLGAEWGVLPEELAELILSKLSLVDLARFSATCRTFLAVFRRELAREQQACCDTALERFGRERIITLIALIEHGLKGEGVAAYMPSGVHTLPESAGCYILRDGTCREGCPPLHVPASQLRHILEPNVIIWASGHSGPGDMSMQVQVQNGLYVCLVISLWPNAYSQRPREEGSFVKFVKITLYGNEGFTVVQALLMEGLAQKFHDAGYKVVFEVWRNPGLTHARFKAEVAPLMSFITPHRFGQGELEGVLKLPTSG